MSKARRLLAAPRTLAERLICAAPDLGVTCAACSRTYICGGSTWAEAWTRGRIIATLPMCIDIALDHPLEYKGALEIGRSTTTNRGRLSTIDCYKWRRRSESINRRKKSRIPLLRFALAFALFDPGTPLLFGRLIRPAVYAHAKHSQCARYNYS